MTSAGSGARGHSGLGADICNRDRVRARGGALREALRMAPRQSAGGWSQWLYEHLKVLCLEDDEMFALLLSICRFMAAGRITERVAETLTTGRLLAMAKPECDDCARLSLAGTLDS
jgi:hypothetical protein